MSEPEIERFLLVDVLAVDLIQMKYSFTFYNERSQYARNDERKPRIALSKEMDLANLHAFKEIAWTKEIKCFDPFDKYPIFNELFSMFKGKTAVAGHLQACRKKVFLHQILDEFHEANCCVATPCHRLRRREVSST